MLVEEGAEEEETTGRDEGAKEEEATGKKVETGEWESIQFNY